MWRSLFMEACLPLFVGFFFLPIQVFVHVFSSNNNSTWSVLLAFIKQRSDYLRYAFDYLLQTWDIVYSRKLKPDKVRVQVFLLYRAVAQYKRWNYVNSDGCRVELRCSPETLSEYSCHSAVRSDSLAVFLHRKCSQSRSSCKWPCTASKIALCWFAAPWMCTSTCLVLFVITIILTESHQQGGGFVWGFFSEGKQLQWAERSFILRSRLETLKLRYVNPFGFTIHPQNDFLKSCPETFRLIHVVSLTKCAL